MQRERGGHWATVVTLKLDGKASTIFTPQMLPAGTSKIRIAISVNQVGTGYLGGFANRSPTTADRMLNRRCPCRTAAPASASRCRTPSDHQLNLASSSSRQVHLAGAKRDRDYPVKRYV